MTARISLCLNLPPGGILTLKNGCLRHSGGGDAIRTTELEFAAPPASDLPSQYWRSAQGCGHLTDRDQHGLFVVLYSIECDQTLHMSQ